MKILFIAMADSVHTVRWVTQITDQRWDISLFPSYETLEPHPDLKEITVYSTFINKLRTNDNVSPLRILIPKWILPNSVRLLNNAQYVNLSISTIITKITEKFFPWHRVNKLVKIINEIKPDIVHSLEIQHAGYLALKAKKKLKGNFPQWIVTNWGSDIYYFGKLKKHAGLINEVLSNCDFYSCECNRDVSLAKQFNLKGKILPVIPNSGGLKLEEVITLRDPNPPSKRKCIALKGYQNWAGRASIAFEALKLCADSIKDYQINMYSPEYKSIIIAQNFTRETGIKINIIPRGTSHKEILKLHGKSRVSIGISASDAISTSFLEAITMGSFPIQSNTSCAGEWIKDGYTGMLVPYDNPILIANAITKALTDDHLVDNAQMINYQTVEDRLSYKKVKNTAVNFYTSIFNK